MDLETLRKASLADDDAVDEIAQRQTGALMAVAMVVMLRIPGLFVVRRLRTAAMTENCVSPGA